MLDLIAANPIVCPSRSKGHIQIIFGPMFSGKTQTIDAVSRLTLSELTEEASAYSVIGIDEGQFFPDTVAFAEEMANNGKIVIVAALDGTYQQKGFGDILSLIPLAESVVKLSAVCMDCFENAPYTKRIGSETELEVIGGSDKYMAVCRKCLGTNNRPNTQKSDSSNILCDISNSQASKSLIASQ